MTLLEALHNFVDHMLNRTSQVHQAADLLHEALAASGHANAAATLDTIVTDATLAAAVVGTVIDPAP
ncbi:hypothetical protein UFOVP2_25 [uncultured Caudovirales phage]|uniref:Uncharacterized protein n=1 Tax=uncultured Caudovirales phage TaxID=2100421 RepID=A0A6J5KJ36_9CAUD|nr:hypothetical protein UFOVP2_25 [uncultured Caudovirales phage]